MMGNLGRLEKVGLRDIWLSEAQNFTPWLAQEENISLLSDTLGFELEIEAQERNVGPFRADILCKNLDADDSWVLIENQLERTNHTHLGQLMTYAAGLEAVTIIWIAAKFTEEHREALDWLNRITNEKFQFFGLELELWKIGDSPAAPKFNIVSKPNQWTKDVRAASRKIEVNELSEVKQTQYEYWKEFNIRLENHKFLRIRQARPQHWLSYSIGRSIGHIDAVLNTKENRISVSLELRQKATSSVFFHILENGKDKIELEIGSPLEWQELPDTKRCRIILYRHDSNVMDRSQWPAMMDWMQDMLEKFHTTFSPRVKEIDIDEYWDANDPDMAYEADREQESGQPEEDI